MIKQRNFLLTLFFTVFASALMIAQGNYTRQLSSGSTMYKGDVVASSNGQYELKFQSDGNLALYGPGRRYMWDAKTNGKGNRCTLQSDGNFVVYDASNNAVWSTETMSYFDSKYASRDYKPTKLEISDGGECALKSVTNRVVWSVGNKNAAPNANTGNITYRLSSGSTLYKGDAVYSSNGRYQLRFQSDGNLALYGPNSRYMWDSKTNGRGNTCTLQSDGNFVVYDVSDRAVWSSETMSYFDSKYASRDHKPVSLTISNSGYCSLKSATNKVVWTNGKKIATTSKPSLNLMITRGQNLDKGKRIYSPNGDYYLTFQFDGNLVLYNKDSGAVFNTNTQGKGALCSLQQDGHLVVYDGANKPLWFSRTHSSFDSKFGSSDWKPYKLIVSNDGKAQLVSSTGRVVWEEPR